MEIKKVDPTIYSYRFSPYNRPTLYVDSGDTVQFEALDTYTNALTDEHTYLQDEMNPLSGPVYVRDAMPGDTLKITVEDIEVTGDATMFLEESSMIFFGQFLERQTTVKIPIKDGYADMFGNKVKLDPMLGILGIAPKEKTPTMFQGVYGGNMDCKKLTKGTILYLPVQVPGALLSTGDIHAKQGDGEIVCGLEVPGIITLKVEVIKDKAEPWPILETPDRWYVIASTDSTDQSNWEAVDKMVKFVWNRTERYTMAQLCALCSICGDLEICQVVDPLRTTRFGLDKDIIQDVVF